jgi:GntR family negative regulator for fad regulon and positive regulator of fabA
MKWKPLPKPAEIAEQRLLEGILSGQFPVDSHLPGERDLAELLGVTRPTLREALQRLGRDGWVEIQHGKPTRVRDYWREGSLGVLATLAASPVHQPENFVSHLMEIRALLAPAYTRQAVENDGPALVGLLENYAGLDDTPQAFAAADWALHNQLTLSAGNPIFRLLLNSFEQLYAEMGQRYFEFTECRQHSRAFYAGLLDCARRSDGLAAASLVAQVMQESLALWIKLNDKP